MQQFDSTADSADAILASVIRSSLDCIIVIDENGHVVEFNPAAEATFGYSRAQAMGREISELIISPRLRNANSTGHAAYLAGGAPGLLGRRIEQTAMRADGSEFPVELAITEAWNGSRRFFTASLRDLSERYAADAALRATQARFAAFMKHAPIGMYLKDTDGRYVMANPEMTKVFGRPAEEAIGLSAADIFGEEEAGMIAENDRRVLSTGQPVAVEEFLSNAVDYAWSLVVRFPVQWADQQQARIGGFDIDITEQKRAAERLADSERRFREVTHHHPVPVVFIDPHNQLIIANPAFRDMMGVGPDDEERFLQHRWFAGRDEYRRINAMSRELPRADGIEAQFRRLDGSVFPASLSWRHIEMDGQPVIVGSILDLTATRAAEAELARSREALAQSERLNALGSLLAGVSHELNNPLAVVVGQALMLEEELTGTAHADRAGKIRRAADRCARIVQTFLAMARERHPERRSINVNDLIRAALDIASYGLRTAGVEVTSRLAEGLPSLEVDPDQMHQVLYNLIVNAQQALQEIPEPRRIVIETARVGNGVEISISDNGPGVPQEIRSRIFDPFFTTKPLGVGTGIGLAFSLGVVHAHNGQLELLDSADGAHFRLRLPVEICTGTEPEGSQAQFPKGGVGRTALVVDDEPDVAEMVAVFLEIEGFAVTTVEDGASAKRAMTETAFDAVFCDLRMPNTDGPALFDWAREKTPEVASRFVFVTGDTLGSSAARFLERARRPVVEKPFTREAIREAIAALAEQSRQAG
ncbi:PAS domain S-box protein [Mesorhizobium sp. LHD-90]|uniref:PAS domain S-box protein n=1 Tax=Mesorhizobium sp. LHD-90 TaxID=3071414 RepID=UPI0027DFBD30|nr:PAS domain S-box protein [Mesorhizobium sp. LHD-90]MDQ6433877.1 PAS domain S-box protein [Mesorhizobium sp. LHD-90]